ncbi:hypothetical protein MKX01_036914 [Papaver californicum]|nr:hypothetical protein MKX01_036914 [Papaver californicum]
MKSAYVNLVRFLSVLSLSSLLFLTVSAQTDETDSTVTGVTNSTDALAIQLIMDTFSIYELTDSDPCLPEPYSWVRCSSDDTPRITEINLHSSRLVGTELPDFSAMDALEKIDLGDNILLAAEFPDFFANFPKLKVLYLVGSSFYGTVPTSLKKRADDKTLTLMLSRLGTDLCYSDKDVCPPTPTKTGTQTSPGTDEGTSTTSSTPSGTGTETSPGTNEKTSATSLTSTPPRSRKNKTTPIVLGTLIPFFVIFSAIVGFLATKHQKRKAAAAAGLMNGTSGLGMPMHGNATSPSPLLPGMNFQDLENAAQNILPDDGGVNTDRQMHPTV